MHVGHTCRKQDSRAYWLTFLPKDMISHVSTPLPGSVGWHWTDAGKRRGVSGSSMPALTGVSNEKAARDAGSRTAPTSSLACTKPNRASNTASYLLLNLLSIVSLSTAHILPTMAWHQALYSRPDAAAHLFYRLSLLLEERREGFIEALVLIGAPRSA